MCASRLWSLWTYRYGFRGLDQQNALNLGFICFVLLRSISCSRWPDSIDQGYDDTQGDVADAATHVQCGLSRIGLRVNYKTISFGRPIRQHWCAQSRERALQAASLLSCMNLCFSIIIAQFSTNT
jgi:hypothetical protein